MEGYYARLTALRTLRESGALVTTAAEAAAIDARAIADGTSSWSLMQAAGRNAATLIAERFSGELTRGVQIVAGAGNNGGDGYVVAAVLASLGIRVTVLAVGDPKTPDALRARNALPHHAALQEWDVATAGGFDGSLVVDAILGTGANGEPRGRVASAIMAVNAVGTVGIPVVALDVPSGVDATDGATPGMFVKAALTITFGTVKRGLLRNRDAAGEIVAVDIGLGAAAGDAGVPALVDGIDALAAVPRIAADAHKGSRRRLLVVGGAEGMAGASILAARAALRSGIGMVKLCVDHPSLAPVQAAVPAALALTWSDADDALAAELSWADAVLIGPGLGASRQARDLSTRVLEAWRGPVVVDADCLNGYEGRAGALGALLAGRQAVVTPHVVEAERLSGVAAAELDAGRFEAAARLASLVQATVLLKGVPTIVSDGASTVVVAAGTPVLATGGSGDVLGGMVAALLAQTDDAMASAASGAWVHGNAGEIAGGGRTRGATLDDVVDALRHAWSAPRPPEAPILADLARISGV